MSCHGCPGYIDPLLIISQNGIGPQGPQGIAGPPGPVGPAGLTWQGAWSALGVYAVNDAVGHAGASYFCINAVGPSGTNPALDTTNWALLAAQGATGQQGIQGVQGLPGTNGVSAYVYVGFAVDSLGTNFNTVQNAGGTERCYMNILTSTAIIGSLTASSFVVGGSVTYVTGWINLCSNTGTIPNSGVFTSGSVNPTAPASAGDVYLNTTSGVFFYYTGAAWDAIPNANPITNYVNITPAGSFTVGTRTPQYRQTGTSVKTKGSITTAAPSLVITDTLLFTYNAGYRPLYTKYAPVFDPYTATWATVRIDTNGQVTLLGTKTPVYVDELSLDTIQFELI